MKLGDFVFERLTRKLQPLTRTFDCNHSDLNGFLRDDALSHQNDRFFSTYVFTKTDKRNEKKIVAFFSVRNSSIQLNGNVKLDSVNRLLDPEVREAEFPAIMIGRLAVDKDFQRKKLGSQLLDFIKGWVDQESKSAFRLLVLDAYNTEEHLSYYSNNGFTPLIEADKEKTTRLMYYDMYPLMASA